MEANNGLLIFLSSWGCLKSNVMFSNINNNLKARDVLNEIWYSG